MFQYSFRVVRSRHPLARLLVGVIGLLIAAMLLAIGVLSILSRYVIWDTTNTPVLVGLGFLLAGLWVATKWR